MWALCLAYPQVLWDNSGLLGKLLLLGLYISKLLEIQVWLVKLTNWRVGGKYSTQHPVPSTEAQAPRWKGRKSDDPVRSAFEEKSLKLDCAARGKPKPKVTWHKDGTKLTSTDRITVSNTDLHKVLMLLYSLNIIDSTIKKHFCTLRLVSVSVRCYIVLL